MIGINIACAGGGGGAQESLFEATGRERLRALQSATSLLLTGEDLGPLPA